MAGSSAVNGGRRASRRILQDMPRKITGFRVPGKSQGPIKLWSDL